MSEIYHNGHWYGGGQDIDIQSDPTATSFESGKVPTGDTVQSVLNSNIGYRIRMYSDSKQAQTFSPWVGGIYYKDFEFELPEAHTSGNFLFAISHNTQFWVESITTVPNSATKVNIRCCTVTTNAIDVYVSILYLV